MHKKKKLTLSMLTALVAGDMIGSGIFLLPSELAQLGSLSLVSWVFTTIGALLLALVFSHMSTVVTKTGGPYAYAQVGLGNFMGFQTAYGYWVAIWVGNAAIVIAAVSYLSVFFPSFANPTVACFISIGFIWLFTLVNINGVHSAGMVQLVTTILKLIPILLIALVGWFYFFPNYLTDAVNVSREMSNTQLITHAATLTLWAFIGLESATVPSGSVINPKRNIPLATMLGTIIAAVVYIASSTAIMGMIPNASLRGSLSPFADAAELILGDWGRWLMAIGAIISCLGSLNGWILLQGQIPMAAAKDGLFPKIFNRLNKKHVPALGLVVTSILISLILLMTMSATLVEQFKIFILVATLANLLPYLYTSVVDILVLHKQEKRYKLRGMLIIAIFALIYSFWAILGAGSEILSYGAILLFSSVPLYIFVKGSKEIKLT
ncbi:MAG: Arginine/agmatine antiporter [Chlamydiae bacterium]|nr:Arginine/agmatine antiporter [Chlamydiota bacterium]